MGGFLLAALLQSGRRVVVLKRSTSNTGRIDGLLSRTEACYDLDATTPDDIFRRHPVQTVVHTAVNYGRQGESLWQVLQPNFLLPIKLYHAVTRRGGCFMTMDSFYSKNGRLYPPALNYCLSKRQLSEWLQHGNGKVVNFRLEHLYGPHDRPAKFIPSVILAMLRGEKRLALTDGIQQRDFIYVDDAAGAIMAVLANLSRIDNGYNEFQVGTGRATEIRRVLYILKEIIGDRGVHLDFGALPMSPDEIPGSFANNRSLIALGWRPQVDLTTGLSRTVDFYRRRF